MLFPHPYPSYVTADAFVHLYRLTVEILLRTMSWSYSRVEMWRFLKKPLNMLDWLSVVPFWIIVLATGHPGGGGAVAVVRLARLIRVIRLLQWRKMDRILSSFTKVYEEIAIMFLMGECLGPGSPPPST